MAVGLLLPAVYVEFRRADTAPFGFFEGIGGAKVQRIQRVDERGAVRARVDKRAYGHIAADAGKCVEIAGFHGKKLGVFIISLPPTTHTGSSLAPSLPTRQGQQAKASVKLNRVFNSDVSTQIGLGTLDN